MSVTYNAVVHAMDARYAFGAVGIGAVVIWPHANSLRAATFIQCLGAAGLATYFALGGATTAATSCAIAMVQLVAATTVRDRTTLHAIYVATLFCLSLGILSRWEGWPSMLAGGGTMLSTYARTQGTAFRMKKWFLIASPFWLIHNIITASYFALVIDALSLMSSGWSVLEDDRKVSVFAWQKNTALA